MDNLLYLKNVFCKNALSFRQLDGRTRMFVALLLLGNVIYIILNGKKYLSHFKYLSQGDIAIIVSAFSVVAFIYVLREHLYKTLDFSVNRMGRAIVFGNATYFLCFIVYWLYNTVMSILYPVMGGDVQGIKQMAKVDWYSYGTLVFRYIFSLLNEELLICAAFLVILSIFSSVTVRNVIISLIGALAFFSVMHVFAWNLATIPAIMMNKAPAIVLFVFFMDIKPLYFSHLFNNCWVSLSVVEGMTGSIKSLIFFIFLLPLMLFLVSHTIQNFRHQEGIDE